MTGSGLTKEDLKDFGFNKSLVFLFKTGIKHFGTLTLRLMFCVMKFKGVSSSQCWGTTTRPVRRRVTSPVYGSLSWLTLSVLSVLFPGSFPRMAVSHLLVPVLLVVLFVLVVRLLLGEFRRGVLLEVPERTQPLGLLPPKTS